MKHLFIVLFIFLISSKSFPQSLRSVDPKHYYISVSDSTALDSTYTLREQKLYLDNSRLTAINKQHRERRQLEFTAVILSLLIGIGTLITTTR